MKKKFVLLLIAFSAYLPSFAEAKTSSDEAICQNILNEDQYVAGERFITKEKISTSEKDLFVYICGISDQKFTGKGDGKYANAIVINNTDQNFSVGRLKALVDKYQENPTVIMHIVIDTNGLLNE